MRDITNTDDVIDSLDVIARIEELEDQRDAALEDPEEPELDEDEAKELAELKALASEGEGLADWTYGAALIHEDHFEDYARQLAEDIGAIDPDASWPASYIDWEAAADALKVDYTAVDFGGQTYFARS